MPHGVIESRCLLHWSQNETLESIACQLQKTTKKYVYVADGLYLRYYSDLSKVPDSNRKLEFETTTENGTEYYIRDSTSDELLCCFLSALKDKLLSTSIMSQAGAGNKYISGSEYIKRPKIMKRRKDEIAIPNLSKNACYVPNPNAPFEEVLDITNPFPVAKTITVMDYI